MVKFTLYDSKHEVPQQFGRNKRQKTVRLHDTFNAIPLHERSDQLPSVSTAINKGIDYAPHMRGVGNLPRVDEKELKYQSAAGVFRGARKIRSDAYVYKHSLRNSVALASKRYLIDEDHYLNTRNESRFGLHGVNKSSRDMYKGQDANTVGSTNHTRYAGLERHKLPEFYPRLPESVPESMVEVNVPNRDTFRFNEKTVEDVPQVFPNFGF
jgi:hypothetical protein